MRWLVTLVLVAACGKPEKQCGPEAYELEEYLKKIDKGLGWIPLQGMQLVERTDLDKRFLQQSPVIRLRKGRYETASGRAFDEDELEMQIMAQRRMERGYKDDQLVLLIDGDTPWWQIVMAQTKAATSSITRLAFVFAAKPATEPPPRHAIDDELDRIEKEDFASNKAVKLAEVAKRVFEPCIPLSKAFGKVAMTDAMDRETQIIKAMTPALLECDCKVDMGALRSLMYRLIATKPVVVHDLTLSAGGTKVELPPDTPWREAQKQLPPTMRSIWVSVPPPPEPVEEPTDAGVDAR